MPETPNKFGWCSLVSTLHSMHEQPLTGTSHASETVLAQVHCVSKNDIDVAYYNFNAHKPIFVNFGRDVAERVC